MSVAMCVSTFSINLNKAYISMVAFNLVILSASSMTLKRYAYGGPVHSALVLNS